SHTTFISVSLSETACSRSADLGYSSFYAQHLLPVVSCLSFHIPGSYAHRHTSLSSACRCPFPFSVTRCHVLVPTSASHVVRVCSGQPLLSIIHIPAIVSRVRIQIRRSRRRKPRG